MQKIKGEKRNVMMLQLSKWKSLTKLFMIIIDVIILNLSFLLSYYIRFEGEVPQKNIIPYYNLVIYISITFIMFNFMFGLYTLYNKSFGDIVASMVIIQGLMVIFVMAFTFFGRGFAFPRTVLAIYFFIGNLSFFIWKSFVYRLYYRFTKRKDILLIGKEKEVYSIANNILASKSKIHNIKYIVTYDYLKNLKENIDKVDIIFIASSVDKVVKNQLIDTAAKRRKKVFLSPSYEDLLFVRPNLLNIEDETILEVTYFKLTPEQEIIKRFIDIVFSIIIIVITLPLMTLTMILIKLTSRGPIFYKQTRITRGNKEFDIYKFRSMKQGAEEETGPTLAKIDDDRITLFGKFLRTTRIDEFPQLFNVLKGDMSVIGPRPERPYFVKKYDKKLKHYKLRHNVRAGITGYAQVYGKYSTDYASKLNFDLMYIKKYSLLLDIKILFLTIKTLFSKIASRGVDDRMDVEIEKIYEEIGVTLIKE